MEPPPPTLPLDLQLEIVARTADDVATVVHCAAASKHLRRAMRGAPGLHHLLKLRTEAAGGFDPALLLGVSYASRDGIVPPSGRHLGFDAAGLLRSSELLSSRDGQLVLRPRGANHRVARVHNTFTGHVSPHLCRDAEGMKWGSGGIYHSALLAVGGAGAGATFKLLAMDVCLRARIFSSEDGKWCPVRVVRPPPEHNHWTVIKHAADRSPLVIGRTVHWICHSDPNDDDVFILAVHADDASARAAAIEPPPGCRRRMARSCAMAATADGRLGVVVAGTAAISMWTLLSPAEGWSRQVVIGRRGIGKQVTPGVRAANRTIWIMGFGVRNGTVLFWMDRVGLVQLNMGTKKAVLLHRCTRPDTAGVQACLHEIDLVREANTTPAREEAN